MINLEATKLTCRRAPNDLALAVCRGEVAPAFGRTVEFFYPNSAAWFDRVSNGIVRGERGVLVIEDRLAVLGVAIIKLQQERKICSFWLADEARGKGAAAQLMHSSLLELRTRKPLFTIPSELMQSFECLVADFGFENTQIAHAFYRSHSSEFVFNGYVSESECAGNLSGSICQISSRNVVMAGA